MDKEELIHVSGGEEGMEGRWRPKKRKNVRTAKKKRDRSEKVGKENLQRGRKREENGRGGGDNGLGGGKFLQYTHLEELVALP